MRNDINNGGSLTKSYYRYCDGDGETIEITTPMTVNGNGAIIDMAGLAIRAFNVSASGVTIKDLTIKNANCDAKGGAIYFNASGNVTNCNFINNTASAGGALYFNGPGNVAECNFTDNKVNTSRSNGGAVYFSGQGDVRNCNFIDNKVTGTTSRGGALSIDSGNVLNCNFTSNSATYGGGAVYFTSTKYPGIVENCNFTNNTARLKGGAVYSSSKNTTNISTVRNCSLPITKRVMLMVMAVQP